MLQRRVLVALLMGGGQQATAAATFVKNIGTATKTANPNANISATVPASGVAAGNTIIASFGASTVIGTPSCTDSKGNTYTVDVTRINGTSGRVTICSAPVVTALVSGDTITASYPSFSGGPSMSATEFSGLLSATRLDQTASDVGNN